MNKERTFYDKIIYWLRNNKVYVILSLFVGLLLVIGSILNVWKQIKDVFIKSSDKDSTIIYAKNLNTSKPVFSTFNFSSGDKADIDSSFIIKMKNDGYEYKAVMPKYSISLLLADQGQPVYGHVGTKYFHKLEKTQVKLKVNVKLYDLDVSLPKITANSKEDAVAQRAAHFKDSVDKNFIRIYDTIRKYAPKNRGYN